ncbi:MAG: hypothetical protein AAF570_06185 [Bacteroidota bacterium]
MKRLRLFEFGDQAWVPKYLRVRFHEILQHQVGPIYRPVLPLLKFWIKANHVENITDLGSGTGGPWPELFPEIKGDCPDLSLTLSDQHPHPHGEMAYQDAPVDMNDPASWPAGGISIFSGLHHLKTAEVQAMLRETAEQQRPIFVAEFTERSILRCLGMFLSPILLWATAFHVRPFSWGRIFLTYLLPVIPFMYFWDGLISNLRSFNKAELDDFARMASVDGYRLQTFRFKIPGGAIQGIYSVQLTFSLPINAQSLSRPHAESECLPRASESLQAVQA